MHNKQEQAENPAVAAILEQIKATGPSQPVSIEPTRTSSTGKEYSRRSNEIIATASKGYMAMSPKQTASNETEQGNTERLEIAEKFLGRGARSQDVKDFADSIQNAGSDVWRIYGSDTTKGWRAASPLALIGSKGGVGVQMIDKMLEEHYMAERAAERNGPQTTEAALQRLEERTLRDALHPVTEYFAFLISDIMTRQHQSREYREGARLLYALSNDPEQNPVSAAVREALQAFRETGRYTKALNDLKAYGHGP